MWGKLAFCWGKRYKRFGKIYTYPFQFQVIWRLCRVIDKTCISPTSQLEQHIMWDDIANLARYLLMLSFNNSLGKPLTIEEKLPDLRKKPGEISQIKIFSPNIVKCFITYVIS